MAVFYREKPNELKRVLVDCERPDLEIVVSYWYRAGCHRVGDVGPVLAAMGVAGERSFGGKGLDRESFRIVATEAEMRFDGDLDEASLTSRVWRVFEWGDLPIQRIATMSVNDIMEVLADVEWWVYQWNTCQWRATAIVV